MTPPITIAVVSWNTRELLDRCLASLQPEAEAGRAAVYVHDNASTDGSPELVSDRHPWATLIASSENLGFGRAVNAVARCSEGSWIAPANADVELAPGALEALLAAGESEPFAGVVAPRLVMAGGETQHSAHAFPTLTTSLVRATGLGERIGPLGEHFCFELHWDPERPRRIDWAHGAFLLVRREAFEEIGGFDERQWMYAEDIDLAWRLRAAGWHTRYEPRAIVQHAVAQATRQAFGASDEREHRHMAASYAWMARRRGIAITWVYAALQVAGLYARLALTRAPAVRSRRHDAVYRSTLRRFLNHHKLALRRRSRLLEGE